MFFCSRDEIPITLCYVNQLKKDNMKRILALTLLLFSLQLSAGTVSSDEQENKVVNVKLEQGTSSNSNKYPRTLIPITCVYVDGTVQLTILENLGEIELFVTNQTTGEQWSTVNNWVLQTSTASGVYLVEIVTENGGTYWGTYIL
jgi:hypothetical protein